MTMRSWVFAAWLLVLLVLQVVIAPVVMPSGTRPDGLLVFTVLVGFLTGPSNGLGAGFAGGILLDIVTGRFIGLHALLKAGIGWACGHITFHVYRENPAVALVTVAVAAVVQEIAAFLILWGLGVPLSVSHMLNQLPQFISYSLIIGAVLFLIMSGQLRETSVFSGESR